MKGRSHLQSIQIKNLGVIESATVNLTEGLTVLTGETGAGKTMVLTALSLILGGKADQRLIRAGADRLVVAAEFLVDDALTKAVEELGGSTDDGVLLITRIVTPDGKSKATLGGVPVPAGTLATIGEELVEIHAQSSSIRLAKENVQRDLLDRFSANTELVQEYQTQLHLYKDISQRLVDLEKSLKNREAEIARLEELASLVKKFEITTDLYDDINNEISRLEAVEDLNKSVSQALEIINNEETNLAFGLRAAAKSLQTGRSLDKELGVLSDEFNEGLRSIESVASDLARYRDKLNADPARFDFLQSRKAELNGLIKRFGKGEDKNAAINQILAESKSAADQIADLSGGGDRVQELRKKKELEFKGTVAAAMALSENRKNAAARASKSITNELSELALSGAVIEIEVNVPKEVSDKDLQLHGVDGVVINFSSHKSTKLAPLSKSASGGELSRVMLAIEVVLAQSSEIGTYIFDEVDAGVGGKAAIEVGKKLATVAKSAQVVVVTHLPQVAVWASNHLIVEKSDKGDVTESSITKVVGERRKIEIARLLSGQETSESAREHAGELLDLVDHSALR